MKTSILLLLMLQLSLSALSQGSYKALNFDGQNDYVKVEDNASLDFENELSLEAWVKGGTAGFSGVQRANGSTPQFQVAGDKIHFVYCNGGNIYTAVMNTSSMNWIPQFREQGLSPQLQVVGNKIYYVFIKWDGFYNQLWFASSNVDGTGWTASQKTNTPFDKSSPQMQVVGNNVYLVFVGTQNLGGGNYSYFIVTATGTTNGGAGSFSFTIHDDGSPGKQNPQMQVVGNQIYYVYRRTTDNPFTQKIVTASSQLDGSGWVMIERTGGLSPQLQVDVGKIYYVFVNNGGILMTAQSNLDGTGWIESGAGYSAQEPQFQKVGNNYFYTWTNNLCLFASEVIAGITGWNTVQLGCGVDYHAQLQVVGAKVYFTWEDNAKLYTGEKHGNIINKGDAYGFGLLSGNLVTGFVNGGMDKLKFFAEATSNTSGLIVQAFLEPDWNHIALTFSNSVLKLYINGLLKASNTLLNGSAQTNDFPLSQPYNISPWNYSGTEGVASVPAGVVDWILVEYRDATDAASATSATRIARQAAFLMSNGSIKGLDGLSPLQYSITLNHQLYIAIWHRNHLGIISANPLTESGGIFSYDFTIPSGQAYNDGQKELTAGLWGMFAGDADGSGTIDIGDKTVIWEPSAGSKGYDPADINLDTQISNSDKDDLLLKNLNESCQVPD